VNSYLAIKAQDFSHPWEVVLDRELSAEQKRVILAAWASDASAVESRPAFRWLAGTPGPVPLSHIRSALLALDQSGPDAGPAAVPPAWITRPAGHSLPA